jgi:tRNA(adenine34) deaminase
MHQARIARCVYAAPDPKAGALGTLYDLSSDERLNHRFDVTAGVLADESAELLRRFFRRLRAERS